MKESVLDIVGGTSFDRYNKQSIEETWNMVISDGALVPYAGYKKVRDLVSGSAVSREIYSSDIKNVMIAIVENIVFSIDNNLGFRRVGFLDTEEGLELISKYDEIARDRLPDKYTYTPFGD